MARSWFGGTSNDLAYRKGPGGALYLEDGTLRAWTAKTGGTTHTLLLDGQPVTTITVLDDGQIPRFQGPDEVDGMWVSVDNGPRVWLPAQTPGDTPGGVDVATDEATAGFIADPASDTRTELAAGFALRREQDVRINGVLPDNTAHTTGWSAVKNTINAGRRASVSSNAPDPSGTVVVELPAGDFRITSIDGLLDTTSFASPQPTWGLKIKGAGSGLTRVVFAPAAAGALMRNDMWYGLRVEGITFICDTPGSTFMESHTTHAAQDYLFTDCYWIGPWKWLFDLKGSNNNSEFSWWKCGTGSMQAGGAWLHIGAGDGSGTITDTSDQFLNYYWRDCKHWGGAAALVDAAKGGHFHLDGIDVSGWCNGVTTFTPLFKLLGTSHSAGVCSLSVNGLRVEGMGSGAALLQSEWPYGNVHFTGVDWSSQAYDGGITYGDIIKITYPNLDGPIYTFRDSLLAGGVNVKYGVLDGWFQHRVTFEDCTWWQKLTPSEVVTYDETDVGANLTKPVVEFVRCRGTSVKATDTTGVSIWDARIGQIGELVHPSAKRQVSMRGIYGLPAGSDVLRVNLPVGAIITGLRAMSPTGGGGDTDGGSWTLKTTEGSPTTICTTTVATNHNSGFDVLGAPSVPYLCDTRAKATLTVQTSDVASLTTKGLLILEGYW